MSKVTKSYIIAMDYDDETDHCVLLVGAKKPGIDAVIINSFESDEAKDIWNSIASEEDKIK